MVDAMRMQMFGCLESGDEACSDVEAKLEIHLLVQRRAHATYLIPIIPMDFVAILAQPSYPKTVPIELSSRSSE